jgi:hypothetical protein
MTMRCGLRRRGAVLAAVLLCLVLAFLPGSGSGTFFVSSAMADDDGDDGGGGGSGGGAGGRGGDPGSGGRDRFERGSGTSGNPFRGIFKRLRAPEKPRPQRRGGEARMVAPLLQKPAEIVAIGITEDQFAVLAAEGFVVVSRHPLAFSGSEVVKVELPRGLTLVAARERMRAVAPQASLDFNHLYRPGAGEAVCSGRSCEALRLVGWPVEPGVAGACLGEGATIGLIDTALNPEHASFTPGRVEFVRLVADEVLSPSDRRHGTAVAALIVGAVDSPTPGMLPRARLIAVDAFARAGKEDRAEAYDLVRAMDHLASREVDVMNMSLSGPANALVEKVVGKVHEAGIVIVAAAGNAGPNAAPLYPAAYPTVIAVTAVDRRKVAYRRAGRGDHIDLAAPGVDVWAAASIKGARPQTGTSFAAPFVTAAAALAKASGDPGPSAVESRLARSAEDLGDAGRDPVYGWGLLDVRELCAAPTYPLGAAAP